VIGVDTHKQAHTAVNRSGFTGDSIP